MFFLMLTIVILSLFILSITFFSDTMKRKSIQKRVETLSDFVSSNEKDLEGQLYVFGFRALYLINQEIVEGNPPTPVSDVGLLFNESFFEGTINGGEKPLLVDADFDAVKSRLQGRADRMNAEFEFNDTTISIAQEDPWNIKFTFSSNFTVKDKNNLASWSKTFVSVSNIQIEGFTDPMYAVKTGGNVLNSVKKTPYDPFASNPENLTAHIDGNYYKASASGPSFLQRMEGKFEEPGGNAGIESFVDPEELENSIEGYHAELKSVVDYIYFSEDSPSFCTVTPSPIYWFKLDNENNHLANYNVSWTAGCPI